MTGGLASGKSAISREFARLGASIIDADYIARELTGPNTPVLKEITDYFGHDILTSKGELNRLKLRNQIFKITEDKLWLEALLHPLIFDEIKSQLLKPVPLYVLLVVPLLTENIERYRKLINRTLVVDLPIEIQLLRAEARDENVSQPILKKMIAAQATRTERLALADDIIDNSGSFDDLSDQVHTYHQRYCSLAREKN